MSGTEAEDDLPDDDEILFLLTSRDHVVTRMRRYSHTQIWNGRAWVDYEVDWMHDAGPLTREQAAERGADVDAPW